MKRVILFSVDHPRLVTAVMVVSTALLALLAVLPSVWPERFPYLHGVTVDTDPENMLPADEAARVLHDRMKNALSLHDMLVVGVLNDVHPQGVFNAGTLGRAYELAEFAKTLHGAALSGANGGQHGVVAADLLAPSTVDHIEQAGEGTVSFSWLMAAPPADDAQAAAVRQRAERVPFLRGTLFSDDGKVLALYVPLTSKDVSYQVAEALRAKIAELGGDDQFFITGLPVAEDTFGVEMFIQMAISAPLAMIIIFVLMLAFFRKLALVLSPMILAMVTVIATMSLLVVAGNTVHIMSSMIPIFIMPIAVLDSVHILSEFFDRYQETRDRRATILKVMNGLGTAMLFTSLTTAAGFASLALTPIPPVQVFGAFVALGVMLAWIWTITFIPAYVMFLREKKLATFGMSARSRRAAGNIAGGGLMERLLAAMGRFVGPHAKPILALTLGVGVLSAYGISKIHINDNPVKWFTPSHPIRRAADVLNEHLGGTYMAYLALEPATPAGGLEQRLRARQRELSGQDPAVLGVFEQAVQEAARIRGGAGSAGAGAGDAAVLAQLATWADDRSFAAAGGEGVGWGKLLAMIDQERERSELMKQPEVLRYIDELQQQLALSPVVGKTSSLVDLVKTVHRELRQGRDEDFRVPDSAAAVAQSLITYQNSHRAQDLWHFVTPDYGTASVWVQLKSGDNEDMVRVVETLDRWIASHPAPVPLLHHWFGLTYINVVWQQRMVHGMLSSLAGSALVVLLMMMGLFRSVLWGILSMVPLSVSIATIYGAIGLLGKEYDMPIAVLSSLSLGLAIDYAIHFLARTRELHGRYGSWPQVSAALFGEPSRAIARNVIVIGVGFLPLLLAPLVPYQTVGMFIAAILATAGAATLLLLPALIGVLEPWLFPVGAVRGLAARVVSALLVAGTVLGVIALNGAHFLGLDVRELTIMCAIGLPAITLFVVVISGRGASRNVLPTT
ncbi:MAG: MMPL family transporter [Candidatus Schekmanbacteria bacterium]|nr:MMPL family transporter [Candidatus Schekmanbacteria bacterium]